MKRRLLLLAAALVVVLAGLSFTYLMLPPERPAGVTTTGTAQIGGPFDLADETGRTVTDATFRGQWMLVFFGFTHCPDVCPTTLNDIAVALDQLGDKAQAIQPLFITVDPERDTAEVVADYTAAFDDRILGLTGTVEQIEAMAKAYRIYFKKVPQGDSYTMDHSSVVYLMGPDGQFVAHFSHPTGGEAMAQKITEHLESS